MLFQDLKGCFSPLISASVRSLWSRNGGAIMQSEQEFYQTTCFFCAGIDDPWAKRLSEKSVTVLHASWISYCVENQSYMPISRFVLDKYFDPTQIGIFDRYESLPPSSPVYKEDPVPAAARLVEPLKRPFFHVYSPDGRNDHSPRRIRPVKRQRVLSPNVNADGPNIVKFSTPTMAPKPFFASPMQQLQLKSSPIQIQKPDVSASSSPSSNSSSRSNSSFRSKTNFQSFARVNLGTVQPLTRRKSTPILKSNPLQVQRYDHGLTSSIAPADPTTSNTLTSFWSQIANQTARRTSVGKGSLKNSSILIPISAIPQKLSTFSDDVSSDSYTSPVVFLPGKVHLGGKFWMDD